MNEAIRSLFPVTRNYVYLNHSAVSPLSIPVQHAMTGLIDDLTHNGPSITRSGSIESKRSELMPLGWLTPDLMRLHS